MIASRETVMNWNGDVEVRGWAVVLLTSVAQPFESTGRQLPSFYVGKLLCFNCVRCVVACFGSHHPIPLTSCQGPIELSLSSYSLVKDQSNTSHIWSRINRILFHSLLASLWLARSSTHTACCCNWCLASSSLATDSRHPMVLLATGGTKGRAALTTTFKHPGLGLSMTRIR